MLQKPNFLMPSRKIWTTCLFIKDRNGIFGKVDPKPNYNIRAVLIGFIFHFVFFHFPFEFSDSLFISKLRSYKGWEWWRRKRKIKLKIDIFLEFCDDKYKYKLWTLSLFKNNFKVGDAKQDIHCSRNNLDSFKKSIT